MSETLKLANSPVLWVFSIGLIMIVLLQTVIFYILAKQYAKKTNALDSTEIKKAVRIGFIGTIGPAVAVFAVAVALMTQIGGPITFARIGVIGSAAYEMVSANIGSGGTLGTEEFTPKMLAAAAWVMAFGGSGWLIMVFFTAKQLNKMQESLKDKNPLTIAYMSSFAPFVIFITLSYNDVNKDISKGSVKNLFALIAGGLVVVLINKIVKNDKSKKWLKEWAMGFAVIAAMIVGSLIDVIA